jgi:hypothetical protein
VQVCAEAESTAETTDEAHAAFLQAVQDDPVAQQALAEIYTLKAQAHDYMGDYIRRVRSATWNDHTEVGGSDAAGRQANPDAPEKATPDAPAGTYTRPTGPDARARRAGRRNRAALMRDFLPGNVRLGQATREQVAAAAEKYATAARAHGVKARFLTLIADRMDEGQTVADRFAESDLAALRQEADNA